MQVWPDWAAPKMPAPVHTIQALERSRAVAAPAAVAPAAPVEAAPPAKPVVWLPVVQCKNDEFVRTSEGYGRLPEGWTARPTRKGFWLFFNRSTGEQSWKKP